MTTTTTQPQQLLRIADVMARTALSRSYIYVLIGRGEFPAQRSLGYKCSRWDADEVDAWVRQHTA